MTPISWLRSADRGSAAAILTSARWFRPARARYEDPRLHATAPCSQVPSRLDPDARVKDQGLAFASVGGISRRDV